MELIYVWIEDYKNIKNMGCSLNAKYKETSFDYYENKLTLNLKTTNFVNVFDNNFNVQTIIGANGAGKSNLSTVIASILRTGFSTEQDDYFDFALHNNYFLLYKDRNFFRYRSNLQNIEIYIDNKVITADRENVPQKCAVFKPFLNQRDDTFLTFPQDEHMSDITAKKIDNYFYFDRFRTYDTSHSLRNLFDKNKKLKNKFKVLSYENEYLIFDYYGYEIDIIEEFEWLNRQLNIKIPAYYEKSNIAYDRKWDLVDALIESNTFIMQHSETYENLDKFLNIVVSNGCFMFLLIKLADLFCSQEGNSNIINLQKTLNKTLLKELSVPMELNNCNMKEKHQNFKAFYIDIQNQFNDYKNNKFIKIPKKLEKDLTCLLRAIIKLEDGLIDGNCELYNILQKRSKYKYIPKKEFMISISKVRLNKEMKFLNDLGIFKQNFYKCDKERDNIFSFYALSTGEQRILRFFGDLLSVIEQEIDIFIFDEMDLSWHPEWQRKMIYYITDLFNKISTMPENKNRVFNFIFSTHSPFILSDMSKNNVIMLYRDKDGYAKKYKSEENTFGANIHDLFNNNFFFNDCNGICTMGEFAKDYISKLQKEIQKSIDHIKTIENLESEKIKNIIWTLEQKIQIIGEPIIRKTLLSKFYSHSIIQIYKNPKKLLMENFYLREQLEHLRSKQNEET